MTVSILYVWQNVASYNDKKKLAQKKMVKKIVRQGIKRP